MKAAEIIAEITSLPPEGSAEVSAFMLKTEQEDPALQIALERKHSSTTDQVVSRPNEQAQASVRAALNPARRGLPYTRKRNGSLPKPRATTKARGPD